MAEGGLGSCKHTSLLAPATSGEWVGNNIELNKNNEQKESSNDSRISSCFINIAAATTTNNVNNASTSTLLQHNRNVNGSTANQTKNKDIDDEDDDENNQTFYEAAGEPELVLTFEKSLKTTNDVTSSTPLLPLLSQFNINNADNNVTSNQQKHQLQLDNKHFLSVQMDKKNTASFDDLDEECEGAVGIVSTINDVLNDESEKELNLLYTTNDKFIQVEQEEPPVVLRRKRDKCKFKCKICK